MGILTSVEFDRGSPGKFDSRTLSRETLNRWTGRTFVTYGGFAIGIFRGPLLRGPHIISLHVII